MHPQKNGNSSPSIIFLSALFVTWSTRSSMPSSSNGMKPRKHLEEVNSWKELHNGSLLVQGTKRETKAIRLPPGSNIVSRNSSKVKAISKFRAHASIGIMREKLM